MAAVIRIVCIQKEIGLHTKGDRFAGVEKRRQNE